MYYYIVDPQKLSQREFERVQNQLYSSVSEYRVAGEVVRSTGLRTINQLVENALSHGAKTIVAVGSDDTLNDVINATRGKEIVMGFVPIVDGELGQILGIKGIEQAAKTLGGRRIAELDLGVVNDNLFLSKLSFGATQPANKLFGTVRQQEWEIKFSVDGLYQAEVKAVGGLILNSAASENADPTDGVLEMMLLPKLSNWQMLKFRKDIQAGNFEHIPGSSVVHVKKIEILNPPALPLRAGSKMIAKTPAIIEVLPKALKIIVGKDRKF